MAEGSCVRRSQAVQVALSLHPLAVLESKVAGVDHIDCAFRPQSMVEVHDPSQNCSVAPANRASVHQKPKIPLQSEGERTHQKANTVRPSRSAQHCSTRHNITTHTSCQLVAVAPAPVLLGCSPCQIYPVCTVRRGEDHLVPAPSRRL